MGAARGGRAKGGAGAGGSLWLAANPSKRWGEAFFMLYTPVWLTLCLGIVVPYKLYESFTELEYLLVGLVSAVPAFVIPLLFVGKADKGKCWKDCYWVKANLWIIIFSYVGNYFWTHYFFTVLGASYTFPSWKMNDVPHTTFLLTHVCFLFYHVASNLTLRRLRHSVADLPQTIRLATEAAWVLALAYFIAYLETLAISNMPRERCHPAWEHGYTVPGDRRIHCLYCGYLVSGIHRFSEHLAGIRRDSILCSSAPRDVSVQFQQFLRQDEASSSTGRRHPTARPPTSSTRPSSSTSTGGSRAEIVDAVRAFFLEFHVPSTAVHTPSFVNMVRCIQRQPHVPPPTQIELDFGGEDDGSFASSDDFDEDD